MPTLSPVSGGAPACTFQSFGAKEKERLEWAGGLGGPSRDDFKLQAPDPGMPLLAALPWAAQLWGAPRRSRVCVLPTPLLWPRAVGSRDRGPLWERSGANVQKGTGTKRDSVTLVLGYLPFGPGAGASTQVTGQQPPCPHRVLFQKPRVPLSAGLTPFRGKRACEPKSHFGVALKTLEGKGDKQTPESHQRFVTS